MDNFVSKFFSMKMMTYAMLIFLIAIGSATFLESVYDTQTAKLYVYNALWFNLLLTYLTFNLMANIIRYRLFRWEKVAVLLFHISFIVIMIGAMLTRFVSYEGSMSIKEGTSTDMLYSADPYISYHINDGKTSLKYDEKLFLSEADWFNGFSKTEHFPGHPTEIDIEYVDFQKNMIDSLVTNDSIQETTLEFIRAGKSEFVPEGEFLMWDQLAVSYEKKDAMPGIELFKDGNKIMIRAMLEVKGLEMAKLQQMDRSNPQIDDSMYSYIPIDTLVPLELATLYEAGGVQFVFKDLKRNTKNIKVQAEDKDAGTDYLTLRVTDGKASTLVELGGGMKAVPMMATFALNGLEYQMGYGSKQIFLPFAVACKDFRLKRYPGSMSPSSYESDITIIDEAAGYRNDRNVFMNSVTDYKGYRFFQSSYFPDESGTILSVNHDYWGTLITYLGYLIMTLGMIASMFMPLGRFLELNKKIAKSRGRRKKLLGTTVVALALSFTGFGQTGQEHNHEHHPGDGHDHSGHAHAQTEHVQKPEIKTVFRMMSEEHSEELENLMVQDFKGRIVPLHTLCDQLLRKLRRSQTYEEYNAVQTMMSMLMYRDHWMKEKVIYVSAKGGLREKLELKGNYIAAEDLLDKKTFDFIYRAEYNEAHRKREGDRDEFDKQIIKLNERFEIFAGHLAWSYMKIVPVKGDPNNTWYSPVGQELYEADSAAMRLPITYFAALNEASIDGKYGEAMDLLDEFKEYQVTEGEGVAPELSAIEMEVGYNKKKIFLSSAYVYLTVGFVLLILFFLRVLRRPTTKSEKNFSLIGNVLSGIIFIGFLYHGYGLYARSYITGEVPWTNGYEAMVFIAWMVMLMGFIFRKKHMVIVAGAALLAFLMVFVSEMNLMDPEISPLVPVLKSYWLMIHVCIITGSYAPLGLGCILAMINLYLYIFRNKKNGERITMVINELTYVTEMLLTVGVFMLTIGTFLGGVWANESWGRYWGWDPKETWALVAVIGYAIILHLRYIPALKGKFLFNAVSMWGYALILFTFFGVNFMLVGLHSYAQGDGLGEFPLWLTYTIIGFIVFTIIANDRRKDYKNGPQTKSWGKILISVLLIFTIVPGLINWELAGKMSAWNASNVEYSTWWSIFNWISMVVSTSGLLSLVYYLGKKGIVGNRTKELEDGEI